MQIRTILGHFLTDHRGGLWGGELELDVDQCRGHVLLELRCLPDVDVVNVTLDPAAAQALAGALTDAYREAQIVALDPAIA